MQTDTIGAFITSESRTMPANRLILWCQALFKRQPLYQRELVNMSAHELADLGIGRSELPAVLQRSDDWQQGRADPRDSGR